MKIAKYQIEFNQNCKKSDILIVEKYWEVTDQTLARKPIDVSGLFNLTVSQVSSIVKLNSNLICSIKCTNCERLTPYSLTSQSNYNEFKTRIKKWNFFICSKCKIIEEQKKIAIKKDAIINESWKNLSNFGIMLLNKIIKFNNFEKVVNYYYSKQIEKPLFWNNIYDLEQLNLISLEKDTYSDAVKNVYFLEELKQVYPIALKESKAEAIYCDNTKELKFILTRYLKGTSNPYAGTFQFNKPIIFEQGREYTFGVWKKDNDELIITITPSDKIDTQQMQTRV